jgi:hypothetical protein
MNIQLILEICIIAIIIIAFLIWLFWQIKKQGLKKFAIQMIVKAEDMYEKGKNEEKMNYVIDKVIALIPMPLSLFITRDVVKDFIQKIFDTIKSALDYQKKEV